MGFLHPVALWFNSSSALLKIGSQRDSLRPQTRWMSVPLGGTAGQSASFASTQRLQGLCVPPQTFLSWLSSSAPSRSSHTELLNYSLPLSNVQPRPLSNIHKLSTWPSKARFGEDVKTSSWRGERRGAKPGCPLLNSMFSHWSFSVKWSLFPMSDVLLLGKWGLTAGGRNSNVLNVKSIKMWCKSWSTFIHFPTSV